LNDIQHAGVTSRFEIRIEEKTHVSADGTELVAIRDFVLDVEPESMTVLMGPSGCGKTTLLRIVAGLDDRFVGDVGIPPDTRIGLMFQEPRLLPSALPTCCRAIRRNYRSAWRVAWRWPAPSPPSRTCCCSTSRSCRSTSGPPIG
jgi:ABC-type phosphate/phosphonate transport system ATPase subunit